MDAASARQRFFFVHVMKTGGTSFVFRLLANFDPAEVYPHEVLDRRSPTDVEPYASLADLERLSPERRAAIRVYTGHFPFMARELMGPDVVTLTLLRDPVDRTISVLKHFKRLYARYRDLSLDAVYDDPLVFRHFVENFQTRMFALTPADEPRSFASAVGFRALRDALEEPAGVAVVPGPRDTIVVDAARLAVARENLARVDVIGVNEEFGAFVDALRRRYGWWSAGGDFDARANVSAEPWHASDALRARIARDNPYDVELYAYARELIAGRQAQIRRPGRH